MDYETFEQVCQIVKIYEDQIPKYKDRLKKFDEKLRRTYQFKQYLMWEKNPDDAKLSKYNKLFRSP